MKKYLLYTLFFVALVPSIQAQTELDPRDRLTAGVKAGLNISNVWDTEGQDFQADAKVGFAGGVFVGIPIGKYLGVQPEILISQKGFQGSGTLLATDYAFSRTTTYLAVPLLVQLKPSQYFTIVAGPQYAFLMHQKNVFTAGGSTLVQETEFDNEKIRKNVLGVVGGFDVNVGHIVFAPRAGVDLLNNNGDGTSTTPRYKNRWIQLTLGVRI